MAFAYVKLMLLLKEQTTRWDKHAFIPQFFIRLGV
jgi:hypothetical protein